jgi:hypothetical protein
MSARVTANASKRERRNATDRARRARLRGTLVCARCGSGFTPARGDALYCSNRCRQAAYRARPPAPGSIALIVWTRDLRAVWTYYATPAAAARYAPQDAPFTIVDTARRPWRRYPERIANSPYGKRTP